LGQERGRGPTSSLPQHKTTFSWFFLLEGCPPTLSVLGSLISHILGCRTLPAKLHHQLRAPPIALPAIPAPALDDPEAMRVNRLLEGFWRVTSSGDLQHRLLDPHVPHGAAIDSLRVKDLPLGVAASTSLITTARH